MRPKIAIAAALALAFAAPVQADEYIDEKTEEIVAGLKKGGFRILYSGLTPLIAEGDSHTFTVSPPEGDSVMIVAIGDWDSNDVNMYVHGAASDRLIDSDELEDDMPICEFTSDGGTYNVRITVPDTDAPAFVKVFLATR